jgi:hypothetical protein
MFPALPWPGLRERDLIHVAHTEHSEGAPHQVLLHPSERASSANHPAAWPCLQSLYVHRAWQFSRGRSHVARTFRLTNTGMMTEHLWPRHQLSSNISSIHAMARRLHAQ